MTSAAKPEARSLKDDDPLRPHLAGLTTFLRDRLALGGELEVLRFAGGYSNLTYLVKTGAGELVLRTPPPGAAHIKAGHDMAREGRFLERLHPRFPLAPRPLLVVDDAATSPLGVPFFVMERKVGRVLRSAADLDAPTMRAVSTAFIDALAELHAVDVHATGLLALGKPDGYLRRQVEGWVARDKNSRIDDVSDLDIIARWLQANQPTHPGRATVVHNDFKYDNIVVDPADPARLVGVLDWELAAIGDPSADLGTVLAYWVQHDDDDALKALPLGPTTLPGNLTRAELVARYQEQRGREVEDLLFCFVLGGYRIAVIAQQIYFRYARGYTKDPRFASLGFAVAVVAGHAARAIDLGRVP
ncbi:MAG: phosphotransferase family protein [Deltaproteobacteria bacterium]|nr:phosphotransferase family protein [Deltaproteobacteria bacterium]